MINLQRFINREVAVRVKIEIDCNNTAFEDLTPSVELHNILWTLCKRIIRDGISPYPLCDHNGNVVGKFEVIKDMEGESSETSIK